MYKNLLLILTLLCLSQFASAQLGGLKDKMKKKADDKKEEVIEDTKNKAESNAPASTNPANSPTTNKQNSNTPEEKNSSPSRVKNSNAAESQSRSGEKGKKVNVDLDMEALPYKPSIVWQSLLAGPYYNPVNGEFKFTSLEATFLPLKKKDGSDFKYRTYENPNPPIWMDLIVKNTGEVVGTLFYEADLQSPPFANVELIVTIPGHRSITITKSGSYEAKFFVGGQHFYTFPFNIIEKANADPYSPVPKMLFMEGEWPSWGYFELGDKDALIWNFFYSYQTTEIPNTSRWDIVKLYQYKMQIRKGATIVGVYNQAIGNGENELTDLRPDNGRWKTFSNVIFKHPKGKDKVNLYLSDLADGNYTADMEFFLENKKVETKSFGFTIAGGKIKPDPKADRSLPNEPTTFIEQGKKMFFVSLKK